MTILFYASAAVAILATALAITRLNAVHGLLYLIISLLSVAVVFATLGAPFIAALEVITYAGAIMVLFVFVVMMLNPSAGSAGRQARRPRLRVWVLPALLCALLLGEWVYIFLHQPHPTEPVQGVGPEAVGIALYGPYLLGVELASMLLLAGLVAAYHLGHRALPRGPAKGCR
jgi:NADH-quinone oxidoreductase subunit J